MKHIIIFLIIGGILIVGCDGTTDPDHRKPAIYGTITDQHGKAVENAKIVLLFDLLDTEKEIDSTKIGHNRPNPFIQETCFLCAVAHDDFVKVSIIEESINEEIEILHEGFLKAGMYDFRWNAASPTDSFVVRRNGFYRHRIECSDTVNEGRMFLCNNKYRAWEIEPTAVSDSHGSFKIEYSFTPVGELLMFIAVNGQILGIKEVADSIGVRVSFCNGTNYKKIKIDTNEVIDLKFECEI